MHANPCQNFSSVIYCSVFETQSQSSSWIDHRITFPDMYIVIWDCLSNKPMMTVIRGWCDQSWPYTPTSQMANSYQTANLEFQNCSCESVESIVSLNRGFLIDHRVEFTNAAITASIRWSFLCRMAIRKSRILSQENWFHPKLLIQFSRLGFYWKDKSQSLHTRCLTSNSTSNPSAIYLLPLNCQFFAKPSEEVNNQVTQHSSESLRELECTRACDVDV